MVNIASDRAQFGRWRLKSGVKRPDFPPILTPADGGTPKRLVTGLAHKRPRPGGYLYGPDIPKREGHALAAITGYFPF